MALAVLGFPEMAFGWAVALQFPPFFLLAVVSLIILFVAGLTGLKPFSFITFGLLSASMILVMAIWSPPSSWGAAPAYVAQALLLIVSTFVPFAAIQFLLALFVSNRVSSSEEPT